MNVLFQGGEQFFLKFLLIVIFGGECEHFFKVYSELFA